MPPPPMEQQRCTAHANAVLQSQGGFSLGIFLFFEDPLVNLSFAAAMVGLYSSLIGLFIYHHPGMDSILAPFLYECLLTFAGRGLSQLDGWPLQLRVLVGCGVPHSPVLSAACRSRGGRRGNGEIPSMSSLNNVSSIPSARRCSHTLSAVCEACGDDPAALLLLDSDICFRVLPATLASSTRASASSVVRGTPAVPVPARSAARGSQLPVSQSAHRVGRHLLRAVHSPFPLLSPRYDPALPWHGDAFCACRSSSAR